MRPMTVSMTSAMTSALPCSFRGCLPRTWCSRREKSVVRGKGRRAALPLQTCLSAGAAGRCSPALYRCRCWRRAAGAPRYVRCLLQVAVQVAASATMSADGGGVGTRLRLDRLGGRLDGRRLGGARVLLRGVGQVADGEDRDRGEDAEDRNDDEKLDEGEALLEQVLVVLHLRMCLNKVLLLLCAWATDAAPVSVRRGFRPASPPPPVPLDVAERSVVMRGAVMPAASAPRMRTDMRAPRCWPPC